MNIGEIVVVSEFEEIDIAPESEQQLETPLEEEVAAIGV